MELLELAAKLGEIAVVQHEMERLVLDERRSAIALCDRGTVDSLAYWPGAADAFWRDVHSDLATELGRYETVIHLRTPSMAEGYDHSNPLRIERVDDALRIDAKIATAWERHPNRYVVASDVDFIAKARRAITSCQQGVQAEADAQLPRSPARMPVHRNEKFSQMHQIRRELQH